MKNENVLLTKMRDFLLGLNWTVSRDFQPLLVLLKRLYSTWAPYEQRLKPLHNIFNSQKYSMTKVWNLRVYA